MNMTGSNKGILSMKSALLFLLTCWACAGQTAKSPALAKKEAEAKKAAAVSKSAPVKDAATPSKAASPKAAGSQASGVPAGATQVSPYEWRYTDPKGKSWIYRQTPFGYSKYPDGPDSSTPASPAPGQPQARETPFGKVQMPAEAQAVKPEQPQPTAVRDLGDSLEFQRPTPFGQGKWVVKKTQLNAEEKRLWEESKAGADRAAEQKSPEKR